MFPVASAGSTSTFIPDYYYQNTGKRLSVLGGSFNNVVHDGVFCWYCNYAFSSAFVYSGARLLAKKP
jgi:hypothetical protein